MGNRQMINRNTMKKTCTLSIWVLVFTLLCLCPAAADIVTYTYDDAGRLVAADYGNNTFIDYRYDNNGSLLTRSTGNSGLGNVHPDEAVDLKDAILALQLMSGTIPEEIVVVRADVNGDTRLGMAEALFVLRKISGVE
jgi:YD repeat-containing protein